MTVDTNNLPHNPDELKNILFAMQENYKKEKEDYENKITALKAENEEKGNLNEKLQLKIEELKSKIFYLKSQFYGKKSEKIKELENQLKLFEFMVDKTSPETEKEVQENLSEVSKELSQEEEKAIPTQPKPTGGRKKLPSQLPVVEKVHELPEEEQVCECCGENYEIVFKKESGEKLGVVTQKFYREKNLVTVYRCPSCGIENNKTKVIKNAKVSPSIVSKSSVTDDFIATLVYNKISKGLPFYRQLLKTWILIILARIWLM